MTSSNNDVLLEHLDRGLLTLTLNRPDRRNALNLALTERLVAAVGKAALAADVNAIAFIRSSGTEATNSTYQKMRRRSRVWVHGQCFSSQRSGRV